MTRWYIDTSAAMKLLVEEPESAALATSVTREEPELVACSLLETELRRSVSVHGLEQTEATQLLDGVDLYEMPPFLFREAGLLPGRTLRSLDALHVAAAIQIGVDRVLSYDVRMAAAAQAVGLPVIAPG